MMPYRRPKSFWEGMFMDGFLKRQIKAECRCRITDVFALKQGCCRNEMMILMNLLLYQRSWFVLCNVKHQVLSALYIHIFLNGRKNYFPNSRRQNRPRCINFASEDPHRGTNSRLNSKIVLRFNQMPPLQFKTVFSLDFAHTHLCIRVLAFLDDTSQLETKVC